MSTIIKVKCVDQVLAFDSTPLIASGAVETDRVEVEFCPKWDGLIKTAVFWRTEKDAYHVLLDENDSCAIPPEVLIDDGAIYFGFFGVDGDAKQRTSQVLRYNVVQGAITLNSAPDSPTVDLYTQLLAKYVEMVDIAAAMGDDQEAFEQEMARVQAEFEQEIEDLIAEGLLPDDSVSTAKLQDGAVTAEKLAAGAVDAYTKTQTLTDETKTLYGLGTDAVPNDVFGVLSRFQNGLGNEYVWEKREHNLVEGYTSIITILPSSYAEQTYGKTVAVKNNQISVEDTFVPTSAPSSDSVAYWQSLIPFYMTTSANGIIKVTEYAYVNPSGGLDLYYVPLTLSVSEEFSGYVNSPDPNAYPPAEDDGYTYELIGQFGDKVRFATGSYMGTGEFNSEATPNQLTFDFEPKLVIISHHASSDAKQIFICFTDVLTTQFKEDGYKVVYTTDTNHRFYAKMSADRKTLTWWCRYGSAVLQYNQVYSDPYRYIAFG